MKKQDEKAKFLTELVKILAPEETPNNFASIVLERLDEMNQRIERIENEIAARKNKSFAVLHPSEEQFQIPEYSEPARLPFSNEKACRFEPNKPCDFCSMCSARGF
jgi:hypothetical protein